jgi:hypothetical protein
MPKPTAPFIGSDDLENRDSGSSGQQHIPASFHLSRIEVFLPRQEHPDVAEGSRTVAELAP